MIEVPSVTLVEEVTDAGSTCRNTAPARAGTTAELTVVVLFFGKGPPTAVADPPLQVPANEATAHTKSL